MPVIILVLFRVVLSPSMNVRGGSVRWICGVCSQLFHGESE